MQPVKELASIPFKGLSLPSKGAKECVYYARMYYRRV